MPRPSSAIASFGSFVGLGAALVAQDLRMLDGSLPVSAAYDAVRNRLVTVGLRGETREFDGTRWFLRAVPPVDAQEGTMFYDSLRREVVLVGVTHDYLFAQCRYDGVRWRDVASPTTPPLRFLAAIEFDATRDEVVLFGGRDLSSLMPMLVDTWTFDGTNWSLRSPATSPPPREQAGTAYDIARSRVVMFGGRNTQFLDDTWEWDGTNWTLMPVTNRPSARLDAALTYDSQRSRVVLFGGGDYSPGYIRNDVWEYDGVSWQLVATTGGPSPRVRAAAAFDTVSGQSRFVGGYAYSGPGELFDAWSWNGTNWSALPPTPSHAPHRDSGACFADPIGNGVIRFGGWSGSGLTADTRRWNGSHWVDLALTGPSPRWEAATCAIPGSAWLFGGNADFSNVLPLGDLWQFDGLLWTQVPVTGPSPRTHSAMAYDLPQAQVVLFGGRDAAGVLADTWVFDGTNWQARQPATVPPPRAGHGMACDLSRGKVVMFGGYAAAFVAQRDTWEWNGTDWTQVWTTTLPPGGLTDLTFDGRRQKVLASNPAGALPFAPLWEFDGTDWQALPASLPFWLDGDTRIVGWPHAAVVVADEENLFSFDLAEPRVAAYGTACGATAPELTVTTWPQLGAAGFGIEVVRAPASTLVALVGAIQQASVPVGGCTLLVQPGQALVLLGTSPGGTATAAVPLPANPGLLGVNLFFQAAALAAAAPGGFVLSRGLQITAGN